MELTNYIFKRQLNFDDITKILKIFDKWQTDNLTITYGNREKDVEYTYGLPYVSSGKYAILGNTNCTAVIKDDKDYEFDYLAVDLENNIIAVFYDEFDNEKCIEIGKLED